MIHLLWDIDGTLLSTARAGVFALEAAAHEVCGERIDLQGMKTAGMTDSEIAAAVIEAHRGQAPDIDELARFLRVYEEALPERLAWRQGRVLPNVPEILGALHARDDVVNLLLTGNTARGARTKLRHYRLDRFFAGGGFCEPGDDRATIARRARALVGDDASDDELLVIGDTPKDVDCADVIGVRTLAVATGGSTFDELRETPAWRVVEELPAPEDFLDLIGLGAGRAAT